MTSTHWLLIFVLAVTAFAIRATGLFAGARIKSSRHAWILDELPGLIVVSLVATSLAGQSTQTWAAAGIAFGVALTTNHVVATMCLGVAAFAALNLL